MSYRMLEHKYYVFFDVDGTLINAKSTHSFLRFYLRQRSRYKLWSLCQYWLYVTKIKIYESVGVDRRALNRIFYKNFALEQHSIIEKLSIEWVAQVSKEKNFWKKKVLRELSNHQKSGAEVVLVSGSFSECLKPLADKLKIQHILASELEIKNGVCTGRLMGKPMIGEGKAMAIKAFLMNREFNQYDICHAYGDHGSDEDMLNLVGHPHVIPGDQKLISHGKKMGWDILF